MAAPWGDTHLEFADPRFRWATFTLEISASCIKIVTFEPTICRVSDLVDSLMRLYQIPAEGQVLTCQIKNHRTQVHPEEAETMRSNLGCLGGKRWKLSGVRSDPDLCKEMRISTLRDMKARLKLYHHASMDVARRMRAAETIIGTGPQPGYPIKSVKGIGYGRLTSARGHDFLTQIVALIGTGVVPRIRCEHSEASERYPELGFCLQCCQCFIAEWYILTREMMRRNWDVYRVNQVVRGSRMDNFANVSMTHLDLEWWGGLKYKRDSKLLKNVQSIMDELGPHPEHHVNNASDECDQDLGSFRFLAAMMSSDEWWELMHDADSALLRSEDYSLDNEPDEAVETLLARCTHFGKLYFRDASEVDELSRRFSGMDM